MYQQVPDLEQRLAKLEAQLDRFSLTLHQWQQTQEHLQPMEWRLLQLMQQCSDILDRWTATDQRHVQAIGEVESRVSDWSAILTRLEQDASQRIREFEQTVRNEWNAMRQSHEEPVKRLREQAASLGEICVAATSSVNGFDRAASLFAALEEDLHARLNELARGLQTAVDELKGSPEHGPDYRPAALAGRVESLEQAVSVGQEEFARSADRSERRRWGWYAAFTVLALAVIGAGLLAIGVQRRVDMKLNEAAARVTAAERQAEAATTLADRRVASAREEAERKITEAAQMARKAQTISDVLAAPDLVRFNVTGGATMSRAYAQVLWSRSRGLVFSGSLVPAPPGGTTYQVWLLTTAAPVSVGLCVPDSVGRVTFVTEGPPRVPRPVTGVAVTLEPTGGRSAPSGPTVLTRTP